MNPDRWLELLDENGPLLDSELDELLPDEDWDEDPETPLPQDLLVLADELYVRKSWMQDRVLTHRLTQAEIDSDTVMAVPDYLPLLELIDDSADHIELDDGAHVEILWGDELGEDYGDTDILLAFGAGYFTHHGMRAGDLLGLSVDADGVASATRVEVIGSPLDIDPDPDEPLDVSSLMWTWASDGLLDVARPPLSEMVAEQGSLLLGDFIYSSEYNFAGRRFGTLLATISANSHCDGDEAVACAVLGTLIAYPEATLAGIGVTPGQFQASLATTFGCRIIGWETWREGWDPEAVMSALRSLGPFFGDASLTVRFLDALFAEFAGEIRTAVDRMQRLFVDAPDWPPAINALVGYAQAAGDAQRAADLLEMLEGAEERAEIMRSFLVDSSAKIARNDRCPCGSGRKYKQCHLGKPMLDEQRRADWVYHCALWYAYETVPGIVDLLSETVELRVGEEALGFALLDDIVLKEWGLLAKYRSFRGQLMPAEDLDLIDLWVAGPDRALFEVLDNTVGAMRVRDVTSGDELVVNERSAAPHMKPGSFWVSRIAPVGRTLQFFGGVYPVALHQREAVLNWIDLPGVRGSSDLLVLLSQNVLGPLLQTSTGEDLVFCVATVRPHGDVGRLNEVFEERGSSWLLLSGDTIQATMRRAGDDLRVEAMSVSRMDATLALILKTLPGSEVLEVTREQPRARGSALTGAVVDEPLPPMSKGEEAVVANYIGDYERQWLDMDIPALGGLTPRQAAGDPTRRGDLIRLLASFGETDDPTQMSPARLRRLLGL